MRRTRLPPLLIVAGLAGCSQPETAPAEMSMRGEGLAPERMVWVSTLDRRFHRESCGFLGPDKRQVTVTEAMQHHTICRRCKPPTL